MGWCWISWWLRVGECESFWPWQIPQYRSRHHGGSGPVELASLLVLSLLCPVSQGSSPLQNAFPASPFCLPPAFGWWQALPRVRGKIEGKATGFPSSSFSALAAFLCYFFPLQRSFPRKQLSPHNFGRWALVALPFLCVLFVFFAFGNS